MYRLTVNDTETSAILKLFEDKREAVYTLRRS